MKKLALPTRKQARVEDAMKYGKEILKITLKTNYTKMILSKRQQKNKIQLPMKLTMILLKY